MDCLRSGILLWEHYIFNFWDDDLSFSEVIIEALSEIQEVEEETAPSAGKVILVLTKDGICIIIRDWMYPFAPEIYYNRHGFLSVDEYRLDHVKDEKAYYKYVENK